MNLWDLQRTEEEVIFFFSEDMEFCQANTDVRMNTQWSVSDFVFWQSTSDAMHDYACENIIITNTLDCHSIKLLNVISYVSRIKLYVG
jgi:hypothetical protein